MRSHRLWCGAVAESIIHEMRRSARAALASGTALRSDPRARYQKPLHFSLGKENSSATTYRTEYWANMVTIGFAITVVHAYKRALTDAKIILYFNGQKKR